MHGNCHHLDFKTMADLLFDRPSTSRRRTSPSRWLNDGNPLSPREVGRASTRASVTAASGMYRSPERMGCNAGSIVVPRIVFGRNPEAPACSALRI
jgi:hypothetical protein